ncbi:hypothetical protein D3C80_1269520 [compost metagenome]
MHGLGHKEVWNFLRAFSVLEHEDVVAGDGRVQRRAEFFPVREQFVQGPWFEHGAGQNVSTDFGAFFDHADADFLTGFGGLLLQAAGGGKTSGAGTDDDDVEFHVFAFHRLSPTQGSTVFFLIWKSGVASMNSGATPEEDNRLTTFLFWWRIISTPLSASNTNVCLNWLKAREIKVTRLMNGHFGVLTGIGVPVKIRAVLRSP